MKINLGYCCISRLHENLRCNRTTTKTYIEKYNKGDKGKYLIAKAKENINDLILLLDENEKIGINAFRVSEQLLPLVDLKYYDMNILKYELKKLGDTANKYNMQLSTHPSQYFVLNSVNPKIVDKSIYTLDLFAKMFDYMELDKTPNITLHVGVLKAYDNKTEAIDFFCKGFEKLSSSTKKYLVVENDHNSFNITDCIDIHNKIGIPVVFDNRHYHWNHSDISYDKALELAVSTWGKRIPKLHLSSENEMNRHAHSDYVTLEDYLEMYNALAKTGIKECNIMLECKQKDKAVMKLVEDIEKHFND